MAWVETLAAPFSQWLASLRVEVSASLADGHVLIAIVTAIVLGIAMLLIGVGIARRVGILEADARTGETLGVGLATGLVVVASWAAAVGSGGRSSFTVVAISMAVGLVVAGRHHAARPDAIDADQTPHRARPMSLVRAGLIVAVFVPIVGLLYGSTLAPSVRDGVQPLENMDQAYYAELGAQLADRGTETSTYASGFDQLANLPSQSWYHWGEFWLAAPLIGTFGLEPTFARFYVVLPLLLLAAAALTGTLVRRLAGTPSRGAFAVGFVASLVLAPIPLGLGTFFGWWARGLVYGITLYGLAAVVVLLGLYVLSRRDPRASWGAAVFSGALLASLIPAHILMAALALGAVGSVVAIRALGRLRSHRPVDLIPIEWRRTAVATIAISLATILVGVATGHGLGLSATGASTITAFNAVWVQSVLFTYIGAATFLAIPAAWIMVRHEDSLRAWTLLGTMILTVAAAFIWGLGLASYDTFHVYFGALALFATPIAAVAVWIVWSRLRSGRLPRLATLVAGVFVAQLAIGAVAITERLELLKPDQAPVPIAILDAIERLPSDAKLAYACRPLYEITFTVPQLVGIYAHTGRRVVPMCFEADFASGLLGAELSTKVPSPAFQYAPQRTLFPDGTAAPTSTEIAAFLKDHGIDYIYVDATHPNELVPDAIPIATNGSTKVLEIP